MKVDIDKPYLSCLTSIDTNGKLIKDYVCLQNENPSISPLLIGKMFLNSKTDKDFGTKVGNMIIAVELYYMILNQLLNNKPVCRNFYNDGINVQKCEETATIRIRAFK